MGLEQAFIASPEEQMEGERVGEEEDEDY